MPIKQTWRRPWPQHYTLETHIAASGPLMGRPISQTVWRIVQPSLDREAVFVWHHPQAEPSTPTFTDYRSGFQRDQLARTLGLRPETKAFLRAYHPDDKERPQ